MPIRKRTATNADIVAFMEKQLIVQLGLAGVPQRDIRAIVECDLNRVSKIVKNLKRRRVKGGEGDG